VLTIPNYSYWLIVLASLIRNKDNETEK
jgi:hypothetical protein